MSSYVKRKGFNQGCLTPFCWEAQAERSPSSPRVRIAPCFVILFYTSSGSTQYFRPTFPRNRVMEKTNPLSRFWFVLKCQRHFRGAPELASQCWVEGASRGRGEAAGLGLNLHDALVAVLSGCNMQGRVPVNIHCM